MFHDLRIERNNPKRWIVPAQFISKSPVSVSCDAPALNQIDNLN
jgi:hypothetical protein